MFQVHACFSGPEIIPETKRPEEQNGNNDMRIKKNNG